jgi:hypothetical protein
MSTKISELPVYTGTANPNGDIPISIAGVTYRITPQLLYQTLQQVLNFNHDLSDNANYQGTNAGAKNTGHDNNGFGESAISRVSCNHVNAFGYQAGIGNTLNGMTIFSNSSLPVYHSAEAAAADITVANGASPNCTYLYYDDTHNIISAIRL